MSRLICRACRVGDCNHCNGTVRDMQGNRERCGCEPSHDYEAPEVWPDDWTTAGAENRDQQRIWGR